ncbi:MAG: hypothetical protein PUP93_27330 [Rhizonema sp. NSF051]|nr:hypothetical protein [Rhizonema sp. NSF051]
MSEIDSIWRQLLGVAVCGACVFSADCVTAQITPDKLIACNESFFNV